MSTASGWSFEPANLHAALTRFRARESDESTRQAVYDWLIRCSVDPTRSGREEPDSPGVFTARVLGTNVLVVYTIRPEDGRIFIVDFGSE